MKDGTLVTGLGAAESDLSMNSALRFLARVSHEMRTPLNCVLGVAELLLTSKLDDRQRDLLSAASESGKLLLKLANDVLDLARATSGRLDLDQHTFGLQATVRSTFDMLSTQAATKRISYEMQFDAQLPEYVVGDSLRMQQVLMNLLGNAIKFTSRGHVRLVVTRVPAGEMDRDTEQGAVRFEIHDTGKGIGEDRRACLFCEFSQTDRSDARLYGGSGLGLALCREFVGMMGGDIGVESEAGVGSVFWFELPLIVEAEICQT